MNSSKFGPLAWHIAHTLPKLLYEVDTTEWSESTIEAFVLFMSSKAMILPCVYCRESYRIFIRVLDLRKWFQGPRRLQPVSGATANQYLFTLHNLVNQKLDKPWQFDMQTAIATQLLVDERALMTTLFEWLYILFGNYPQQLGPSADVAATALVGEGEECCNEACRRANQAMLSKNEISAAALLPPLCKPRMPRRCISVSLAQALEHVKRDVSSVSYMVDANEQGVTLGSFVNRQLVSRVYEHMLGDDVRAAVDFYTFSKVCWYIIMLHNLCKLLTVNALGTTQRATRTLANRSPEALRALEQLRRAFLEPRTSAGDRSRRCECAQHGPAAVQHCLEQHLVGWASSSDAIKQVHFARQLWDVKTEPLAETLLRIERYRASKK